ncbi:MAG: outer spore coat protein CotE [bacterium]|nr:outer spore coat protein CotE [bacterium]
MAEKALGGAFRQIITRAVVASGSHRYLQTHVINPVKRPTSILGARVVNHDYRARPGGSEVEIAGNYAAEVWYSHSGGTQTELAKEKLGFRENLAVTSVPGRVGSNETVEITAAREPGVWDARITSGGQIELVVETAYAAEVLGPARLWVRAYPEEVVARKLKGNGTGRDDELSDDEWEDLLDEEEGAPEEEDL